MKLLYWRKEYVVMSVYFSYKCSYEALVAEGFHKTFRKVYINQNPNCFVQIFSHVRLIQTSLLFLCNGWSLNLHHIVTQFQK